MFKNIYKIVVRSMWRYKGYTLLNIFGMAVVLAAMVWGYQTYRYCFSFDNFHKDQENVYRALTFQSGAKGVKGIFPMAAVKQAQGEFAGIAEAVRFDGRGLNIRRARRTHAGPPPTLLRYSGSADTNTLAASGMVVTLP